MILIDNIRMFEGVEMLWILLLNVLKILELNHPIVMGKV